MDKQVVFKQKQRFIVTHMLRGTGLFRKLAGGGGRGRLNRGPKGCMGYMGFAWTFMGLRVSVEGF